MNKVNKFFNFRKLFQIFAIQIIFQTVISHRIILLHFSVVLRSFQDITYNFLMAMKPKELPNLLSSDINE